MTNDLPFVANEIAGVKYIICVGVRCYYSGTHNENRNELVTTNPLQAEIFNSSIGKKKADRLAAELNKKGWSAARVVRLT